MSIEIMLLSFDDNVYVYGLCILCLIFCMVIALSYGLDLLQLESTHILVYLEMVWMSMGMCSPYEVRRDTPMDRRGTSKF